MLQQMMEKSGRNVMFYVLLRQREGECRYQCVADEERKECPAA